LRVAGSTLLYRGIGFAAGGRFTGSFMRTDLTGANNYFGYHVNCENDVACAAYRGPYRATIGGSGPYNFVIHTNNMPMESIANCQ
jgi:hypothetical protein